MTVSLSFNPGSKLFLFFIISIQNILTSSLHELENNGSLSFLDFNITRTNDHFSTSVFHKPTSTGLFTKLPVHSCSKNNFYFCLPYTGQHRLQLRTQIHKLPSSAYPHISIGIVFHPTCTLSDVFFHSSD